MIGGEGGMVKKQEMGRGILIDSEGYISAQYFFRPFLFVDACQNSVSCHPSQICHEVRAF
jgi:hypothetical protein